jgi:hypothetical protein
MGGWVTVDRAERLKSRLNGLRATKPAGAGWVGLVVLVMLVVSRSGGTAG